MATKTQSSVVWQPRHKRWLVWKFMTQQTLLKDSMYCLENLITTYKMTLFNIKN